MIEFLALATWRRINLNDLKKFPRLAALAQTASDEAVGWVSPWRKPSSSADLVAFLPTELQREWYCGNDESVPSAPREEEYQLGIRGKNLRVVYRKLALLGGLAAPAVEALLTAESPLERLHGLALLDALELQLPPAKRGEDDARLEVRAIKGAESGGPIERPIWIAVGERTERLRGHRKSAPQPIRSLQPFRPALMEDLIFEWLDARGTCAVLKYESAEGSSQENFREWMGRNVETNRTCANNRNTPVSSLIAGLRLETDAYKASGEKDFWSRARFIWRDWQALTQDQSEHDGKHWWNWVTRYRGEQSQTAEARDGFPELRIVGPEGAKFELMGNSASGRGTWSVIVKGRLPFVFNPSGFHGVEYRLRVADRNGKWRVSSVHSWYQRGRETVWVEPSLLRPRN
ncbi:MAG TPA: hypothetical protein VEY30_01015 [Myxococcaceae bacterium]|nr:hypothetical protein [Myxococcaceae bacterium]